MTRSRLTRWLAIVLPVTAGILLSILWWLRGGGGAFYVVVDSTWMPALVGTMISGLLLAALVLISRGRRRHLAELHRAQREHSARQRRLLLRLDHELKNPIQGIRAALADEPSDRQRRSIDAQSRRLTSLIGDLRKIGEIEHTALEIGPVDPSALVREAVAATQELPDAGTRRFGVSLPRAPRPLPIVPGDEDLLFLALSNVLGNAVKYSSPQDEIEVRGRATEEHVILEIADTGRGIEPDELDLVWEELGRSRHARGVDGAGLGLPLVRAVLERHGGSASLESWPGEGSTVTLRLPREPGRLGAEHRAPPTQARP